MTDPDFMTLALEQAHMAAAMGEVPVGAVVVKDGVVIGVGRNAPIGDHDPTAHAEIRALRQAAQTLGNYRLEGCELFVTLEPCAMCSGTILHSRLRRVVFGAQDTKTGAAGSVFNLFGYEQLNHQTEVVGGVLPDACGEVLQSFFRQRRLERSGQPLRDDSLRTPDECFAALSDWPWEARYINDLPSLAGLRLHYVDEGPPDASSAWVCVHGREGWSYEFRDVIAEQTAQGHRVVAVDLIGFGRSDKPKKASLHQPLWHRQVLFEWLQQLGLRKWTLVTSGQGDWLDLAQGWGANSAVQTPQGPILAKPMADTPTHRDAMRAPFPSPSFGAALKAFGI